MENMVPVNCSQIPEIAPVNLAKMKCNQPNQKPYLISYSWWDTRLQSPKYKRRGRRSVLKANSAVHMVYSLLLKTPPSHNFVDVGANVGFMTHFAARDRTVYAIDPISYDIAKLCEANRANLETRVGHTQRPPSVSCCCGSHGETQHYDCTSFRRCWLV